MYSDIGDPTSWARRFDLSIVGRREVAGHSDLVMRLVQKVRGMIDHQDRRDRSGRLAHRRDGVVLL